MNNSCTVTNPEYPLFGEHFGDDDPNSNPALAREIRTQIMGGQRHFDLILTDPDGARHGVVWKDQYVEEGMVEAMRIATKGLFEHQLDRARAFAEQGLARHPCCPTAHQVFARCSPTYEAAIVHYETAEEMAPSCVRDFDELVAKANDVWDHQSLRCYYRCLHGRMHCLVKLKRFREALAVQKKLLRIGKVPHFKYSSWANPRRDVLFIYMAAGGLAQAQKIASSKNVLWTDCYSRASTMDCWMFDRALLDFKRGHTQYVPVTMQDATVSSDEQEKEMLEKIYYTDQGLALQNAITNCPMVAAYLLQPEKYPLPSDLRVPSVFAKTRGCNHVPAAIYARSRGDLWRETPNAIAWLSEHYWSKVGFHVFKRSYVWEHKGYAQWLNKIDMMRLVHDYRQESPDPNKMWAPPGKIRNEQGQFVDAPVLSATEQAAKQKKESKRRQALSSRAFAEMNNIWAKVYPLHIDSNNESPFRAAFNFARGQRQWAAEHVLPALLSKKKRTSFSFTYDAKQLASVINLPDTFSQLTVMHTFCYHITGVYGAACIRQLIEQGGGDVFVPSGHNPCALKLAINQGNHFVVAEIFRIHKDKALCRNMARGKLSFEELLDTVVYSSSYLCKHRRATSGLCQRCQANADDTDGEPHAITLDEQSRPGYPHTDGEVCWYQTAKAIGNAINEASLGDGKKKNKKRVDRMFKSFAQQLRDVPNSKTLTIITDRLRKLQTGKLSAKKSVVDKMVCAHCEKPKEDFDKDFKFKKCGRCQSVYYCSSDCQRQHWTEGGHRSLCVKRS